MMTQTLKTLQAPVCQPQDVVPWHIWHTRPEAPGNCPNYTVLDNECFCYDWELTAHVWSIAHQVRGYRKRFIGCIKWNGQAWEITHILRQPVCVDTTFEKFDQAAIALRRLYLNHIQNR